MTIVVPEASAPPLELEMLMPVASAPELEEGAGYYYLSEEPVIIFQDYVPSRFYEEYIPQYEPYVPQLPRSFVRIKTNHEEEPVDSSSNSSMVGNLVGGVRSLLSKAIFG